MPSNEGYSQLHTLTYNELLAVLVHFRHGITLQNRHYYSPLACRHRSSLLHVRAYTFTIIRTIALLAECRKFLTVINWGHFQADHMCVVMYLGREFHGGFALHGLHSKCKLFVLSVDCAFYRKCCAFRNRFKSAALSIDSANSRKCRTHIMHADCCFNCLFIIIIISILFTFHQASWSCSWLHLWSSVFVFGPLSVSPILRQILFLNHTKWTLNMTLQVW